MARKAKLSTDAANGTGTALAVPSAAILLNAEQEPDPKNPHSLMPLIGNPPGSGGTRIMWGVLRSVYRKHTNSATAFMKTKLRPSWSADPNAVSAAWAETLAPANADDSFADAMLLAHRIDRELGKDAEGKTPLWAYATITDPQACRIHVFREELRWVARDLVETYGGAVTAIVHAPGRAGNGNPLHGHLCLSPVAVDGPLGFSTRIAPFCSDRGRQIIVDAWSGRKRFV